MNLRGQIGTKEHAAKYDIKGLNGGSGTDIYPLFRICLVCGNNIIRTSGARKEYCSPKCRNRLGRATVDRSRVDKDKLTIYKSQWYQKNKEKILVRVRKRAVEKRDEILIKCHEHYSKNKDLILKKQKIYNSSHKLLRKISVTPNRLRSCPVCAVMFDISLTKTYKYCSKQCRYESKLSDQLEYYYANREQRIAKQTAHYFANREKISQIRKETYVEHKDAWNNSRKEDYKQNKGKYQERSRASYLRNRTNRLINASRLRQENPLYNYVYYHTITRVEENKRRLEENLPLVGDGCVRQKQLINVLQDIYSGELMWVNDRMVLGGLELDAYFPSRKLAFEYNGQQHYEFPNFFHKLEEDFLNQQKRDAEKQRLCVELGIKLIIVRYDERITVENIRAKLMVEKVLINGA